MSPRRMDTAGPGGARVAVTAAVIVGLALVMMLLVRARPETGAFDPRSSRPDGARGLVLLLEEQGIAVDVSRVAPQIGDDVRVLVLSDQLDQLQRGALLDFVGVGGVVVAADPASSLHGGPGLDGGSIEISGPPPDTSSDGVPGASGGLLPAEDEANVPIEHCTIAALQHLRGLFVRSGVAFAVAPTEPQCFGTVAESVDGLGSDTIDGGHAFVIRRSIGAGTVVGLGDNELLTNRYLRYADNSGLAVALLTSPSSRVLVLVGGEAPATIDDLGEGDQTLGDLVRPSVWMALAQLALAFVVFAFARAARRPRVVVEPLPVPLAGSDFVRARARLVQRARHADAAGRVLRSDLQRELCRHYRLDSTASPAELGAVADERDGVPDVAAVLAEETPDAAALLRLAQRVAQIRTTLGTAAAHTSTAPVAATSISPDLSPDPDPRGAPR